MSRWRVLEQVCDDSFGYNPGACERVIADWLTRAEAKSIYKHYQNRLFKLAKQGDTYGLDFVDYFVETLGDDGTWNEVSVGWCYEGEAQKEQWFDDMGWDYMLWQMHTPEEPYDFKNRRTRV